MRAEASTSSQKSSLAVIRSLLSLPQIAFYSPAFIFLIGVFVVNCPPTILTQGCDHHVSLFPFEGESRQGGQAKQEVVSRTYEVEIAAELEWPACGEVSSRNTLDPFRGWRLIRMFRSTLTSPIVALMVGPDRRVFAAHEDVLSISPFFAAALKGQFFESTSKRVELPDELVE